MTLIFAVEFLAPVAETYLKDVEARAALMFSLLPVKAISVKRVKF
jgi:hypothetical protein